MSASAAPLKHLKTTVVAQQPSIFLKARTKCTHIERHHHQAKLFNQLNHLAHMPDHATTRIFQGGKPAHHVLGLQDDQGQVQKPVADGGFLSFVGGQALLHIGKALFIPRTVGRFRSQGIRGTHNPHVNQNEESRMNNSQQMFNEA